MCDVRPAQQVDLPKRVRGAECARVRGLSPVVKGGGVWMRQNEPAAAEGGGRRWPAEVQDQGSPPVVTFMTTEHFVLQTARSAGMLPADVRHAG